MNNRLLFFVVLVLLLWLLFRNRQTLSTTTAVNIRTVNDGKEIYQECTYADGTSWMQAVSAGPCPSTYQGFPLVQQTLFPPGRSGGLIYG